MQFLSALLLRLFGNGARIEDADRRLGRSRYTFTALRFKLPLVCGGLRVIELASQGVVEYRRHRVTISEVHNCYALVVAIRVSPSWYKPLFSLTGNVLLRVLLLQTLRGS